MAMKVVGCNIDHDAPGEAGGEPLHHDLEVSVIMVEGGDEDQNEDKVEDKDEGDEDRMESPRPTFELTQELLLDKYKAPLRD